MMAAPRTPARDLRALAPLAGALIVIGVAAVVAYRAGWLAHDVVATKSQAIRLRSSTPLAALMFVAAWGVATSLAFPALPFMIAGGALFGTVPGTLLSLAGTAVGAAGGYGFARFVAPGRVKRWMAARLSRDELHPQATFLTLVRLRLVPAIPFSAVTYGAGLARVPIRIFLAATLVGQFPSTLLYSYFADAILHRATSRRDVAMYLAAASALLLVMSLVPWMVRRLKAR